MSYRVEYSPHKKKQYPHKRGSTGSIGLITSIVLTVMLIVCFFVYDIQDVTTRYFSFLDDLAVQIVKTDAGQALTVFYRELLENAKYS